MVLVTNAQRRGAVGGQLPRVPAIFDVRLLPLLAPVHVVQKALDGRGAAVDDVQRVFPEALRVLAEEAGAQNTAARKVLGEADEDIAPEAFDVDLVDHEQGLLLVESGVEAPDLLDEGVQGEPPYIHGKRVDSIFETAPGTNAVVDVLADGSAFCPAVHVDDDNMVVGRVRQKGSGPEGE